MLRKATTRIFIILMSSILTTGFLLSFVRCEHATPTIPCDCGDEKEPIGKTEGSVGGTGVTTDQKVYHDAESGEMSNETTFKDSDGNIVGDAELTAAQDLVAHINLQKFNIPGETFIEMGGHFTMKVVVTSDPQNPTKYKVELTNLDTNEFVSFLVNKLALAKRSAASGIESVANVDPTQFSSLVSTNSVLLCVGTEETIEDSRACRESAPAYCGALGVKAAYIEARFSISRGCESSCKVECKVHDQGGIGF